MQTEDKTIYCDWCNQVICQIQTHVPGHHFHHHCYNERNQELRYRQQQERQERVTAELQAA